MMYFDRFEKLIGIENFEKVKNLKVLIIGVGGVGGAVVESLVRCGVENITIVDPDIVEETNINRQIIATISTLGRKKVEVFQERIHNISNHCKCNILDDKVGIGHIESITSLQQKFGVSFDFVVDACDDIQAKKQIIRECTKKHIPLISCMGTGKRLDPSKLEITTLDRTSYDPIAKILRKFVREEGIKEKIIVLSSKEIPMQLNSKEIPSCIFVPFAAGLSITHYIIENTIKE